MALARIKLLCNRSNGGISSRIIVWRTLSGSATGCAAKTSATRAVSWRAQRCALTVSLIVADCFICLWQFRERFKGCHRHFRIKPARITAAVAIEMRSVCFMAFLCLGASSVAGLIDSGAAVSDFGVGGLLDGRSGLARISM